MNWKASNYSAFWGKTLEYGYKYRLGTNLQKMDEKKPEKRFDENIQIPELYDFRKDPKVKDYLRKSSIRDQGECAASWAFSTLG